MLLQFCGLKGCCLVFGALRRSLEVLGSCFLSDPLTIRVPFFLVFRLNRGTFKKDKRVLLRKLVEVRPRGLELRILDSV